jgi:hypothetical protein
MQNTHHAQGDVEIARAGREMRRRIRGMWSRRWRRRRRRRRRRRTKKKKTTYIH